jgi:hypothetical protein
MTEGTVNRVLLSKIKKDASNGLVINEVQIVLEDKKVGAKTLLKEASKWLNEND